MTKVKKEKKPKVIEPYWQEMVSCYFDFCKEKFNETPSFDGSSPRDLRNIIQVLRKRAEDKGVEWTSDAAKSRFRSFLEHCYLDRWLRDHFILSVLNRQKDVVLFRKGQ
jgi:hypothetical protein